MVFFQFYNEFTYKWFIFNLTMKWSIIFKFYWYVRVLARLLEVLLLGYNTTPRIFKMVGSDYSAFTKHALSFISRICTITKKVEGLLKI